MCRPLLCLCRPFMIFEGCLDSNPEYCRSKLARYRLSHPSLSDLATHPSILAGGSPYSALPAPNNPSYSPPPTRPPSFSPTDSPVPTLPPPQPHPSSRIYYKSTSNCTVHKGTLRCIKMTTELTMRKGEL